MISGSFSFVSDLNSSHLYFLIGISELGCNKGNDTRFEGTSNQVLVEMMLRLLWLLGYGRVHEMLTLAFTFVQVAIAVANIANVASSADIAVVGRLANPI